MTCVVEQRYGAGPDRVGKLLDGLLQVRFVGIDKRATAG